MKYYEPKGLSKEIFSLRYAAHENESWNDACDRVAGHVATAEQGDTAVKYKHEFAEMLKKNLFMPGGRIWYGSGRAKGQLLNCFVISTEDSREGWGQTVSDMIVISGTGGGVGLNCSPVRPRGTHINGTGGTATGAVSLMEVINAAGEVIKAGGGRRTALMLCLNIDHGDLEEFLDKKLDLDQLNNANISVVFNQDPEAFFELVKADGDVEVVYRGQVVKKFKARKIWNKIIDNALKSGEPGILNGFYANKMSNIWYHAELTSTNPCITGDTLIAVADGRNAVPISQLVAEGVDVPVYSTNLTTGKVEIKMGRNPRVTGFRKEVWKVTLDDGSVVRATPNHKFLTKDLTYVELKDLTPGTSLCPFNTFNSNGYRQVCNTGSEMIGGARRNRRQYRLIHEFYNGEVDSKMYAIHHKNFDSFDDSIDNLEVLTHEDHRNLHVENMLGTKNPYHRMSNSWKSAFASHFGESNGRYSGHTNDELVQAGRELLHQEGKFTQELWVSYARDKGYPQFLGNDFRFGSFTNFKSQVVGNHKVASVEFDGYEDVYNITVDDNHNYHVVTSTEDDKYISSSGICIKNCGEIWMSPNDCCCLGSLVLPRFVNAKGEFDWTLLKETVYTAVRFLDDVITINNYPLNKIAETCNNIRRIGLGIMGLHDVLLIKGLRYHDPESLEFVDRLMKRIKNYAYEASIELAKEKGPFPLFNAELFLKGNFIKGLRPTLRKAIKENGVRNAALLTIAPTGTISMVCGVTSGIEPMYSPVYERRYRDASGKLATEVVVHPLLRSFIEQGKDVSHFQGTYDLNIRDHFEMQRVCQRHIDNAVSKTVNLLPLTAKEDLSELYMEFLPELKGVTVYPEGSREDQPLRPLPLEDAEKYLAEASEEATSQDSCKSGVCEI